MRRLSVICPVINVCAPAHLEVVVDESSPAPVVELVVVVVLLQLCDGGLRLENRRVSPRHRFLVNLYALRWRVLVYFSKI